VLFCKGELKTVQLKRNPLHQIAIPSVIIESKKYAKQYLKKEKHNRDKIVFEIITQSKSLKFQSFFEKNGAFL
jgi:hypothetical protein